MILEILQNITLTQPLWLLLAIVPWLVITRIRTRRTDKLSSFADPHLWKWLYIRSDNNSRATPAWPMIIAWLLAAIAASDPALQKPHQKTEKQRGMDIAVVIDISPSMSATDIKPTRLERAKLELLDFIKRLEGDRVGLVAYSSYAYNILPLTHDRAMLRYFIGALDTNLTRRKGSNLILALEQAQQILESGEIMPQKHGKAIIVLSDGESHEGIHDFSDISYIAKRFKLNNLPVYSLGIGTDIGSALTEFDGRLLRHQGEVVISRLERKSLQTLAEQSGGIYIDIQTDDTDWQALFSHINKLERSAAYHVSTTSPAYQLFPWFLGLSIVFFLWSGLGRLDTAAALLLVPFIMTPEPADASPWQEQQAYDAYQNREYKQAITIYEEIDTYNGKMGLGAAAYRLQDWNLAESAYKQARQLANNNIERASAAYNHGNALALLGQYEEAISAYQKVLVWQPAHKRASLNLNLLNQSRTFYKKVLQDKAELTEDATDGSNNDPDVSITNAALDSQDGPDKTGKANDKNTKTDRIQRAISEWELGNQSSNDNWSIALRQQQSLQESPGRVLRQRMQQQDAGRPAFYEEKPW